MSQRADISGNNNSSIQILGDVNVVESRGPHLHLELQIDDYTSSDGSDILNSFYPRSRSTEFIGREPVLEALNAFLDSSLPVSFMVLTGEGGSGKTRMAVELCLRRRDMGWDAGFTTTRSLQNFIASYLAYDGWKCSQNTLVVLDYAAILAQPLHDWFERLTSAQLNGSHLRILLLERTADSDAGWLREVTGEAGGRTRRIGKLQHPGSPYALGPLTSQEDCLALVQNVLNNHGHTDTAWQKNPSILQMLMEATMGGLPLFLMMAAHNIHSTSQPAALTRESLALEFAKREAERIRNRARSKNLSESFLLQLVACITLAQGADRDKISSWVRKELEREPGASGRTDVHVDLLYELLPSTSEGDNERLSPLRPDIIGEAYIWHILRKKKELVILCLKEFDAPVLESLLRLAHDFGGEYSEPLYWLDAVLESKNHPRELAALAALIPSPSMPLRAFKLATAEKHLKTWKEENSTIEADSKKLEYASLLNDYALGLSEMGQREPALKAEKEAVKIWRELSAPPPAAYLPVLAGYLNNLANMLCDVGQREPALEAAKEAADLYRELSASNPTAFRSDLASSLNNLANRLSDMGLREPALKAAKEAVKIRRELSASNPAVFRPVLAGSLNNLANIMSEMGQREPALKAAKEAADLYRELSASNPTAFRPDLAIALNNLANRLSEIGQQEPALERAQETADLYRELSASNPTAFRPYLAMALHNLANRLSEIGQREPALEMAQEAVKIRRELSASNPAAFRPVFASSLNNLANRLSDMGQNDLALEAAQEAVKIQRDLSETNPTAFRPYLAGSLNNLANRLSDMGQNDLAWEAAQEAVKIRRELSASNPAAFRPDLAGSLNNQAIMLSEEGQHELALEAAQEAADLYRDLYNAYPDYFFSYFKIVLRTLLRCLQAMDRNAEATAVEEELQQIQKVQTTNK